MMRRTFSATTFCFNNGEYLLIHHNMFKLWLPVGGEIEPERNETPVEAAAREVLEETGLVVQYPQLSEIEGTPPGFLWYEEHDAGKKGLHMNFVFAGIVRSREIKSDGSWSKHAWFNTSQIRGLGRANETKPNVAQLAASLDLIEGKLAYEQSR